MPRYQLDIIVKGHDKASGPLSKIGSSLGTLGKVSLAGVALGVAAVGAAVGKLAFDGVQAAAEMQNLELALETLVAKEIARGEEVTKTSQKIQHLTEKERQKLTELRLEYATMGAKLQEQKQRVHEMTTKWTEQGLATQTAKARLAEMVYEYDKMGGEIDKLASKEGKLVTVQEKVQINTMELSDALKQATPKAQKLMRQLRDLSIISPFEYQQVADTFRFNLAMGATTETAMGLTKSTLDTGAALGLSAEMMGRMNYNLGQALVAGDLTMANLRQLRIVGLDLADVFESELGLSIQQVRDQLKSGKLEMEDVSQAFMDYADRNFGGAAERMSKTFTGLKSSIADLFFFAGADLFGPGLEVATEVLGGLFDRVRDFLEEGGFARLGEQVGELMKQLLAGDIEALTETLGLSPEVAAFVRNFARDLGTLAETIREGIGKAFAWLAENVMPKLNEGLAFVNEHWDYFRSAIAGAAAALAGASIAGMLLVIVGALNPVILGIMAVGAAVGVLATAWKKDWGGIRTTAEKVSEALQEAFGRLEPVFETVKRLVESVKVAFEEGGLEAAVMRFAEIWPALRAAVLTSVETIIEAIGQAFGVDLLGVFEDVGASIEDTMADLWAPLEEGWQTVQAVFESVAAVVGPAIETFIESIRESLDSFGPVVESFKELWRSLQPAIEVVMAALGAIVVTAIGLIVGVFSGLAEAIGPIIEGLAGAIAGIVTVITGVVDTLTGLITWIVALFEGDSEKMVMAWELMKQGIEEIVIGLVDIVISVFSGLWDGVRGFIEGFVDGIIGFFENLYNELVGGSIIPDMINDILSWFKGMPDRIVATVMAQFGKLIKLGRNIVKSIKQGVKDAWDSFVRWITGKVQGLINALLAAAGFGSPSKPMVELGSGLVTSMQLGWDKSFGALQKQMTTDLGNLTTGFGTGMLGVAGMGAGGLGGMVSTTNNTTRGGDTFNFTINDQNSMALALAMVEDRRTERLNASMGG